MSAGIFRRLVEIWHRIETRLKLACLSLAGLALLAALTGIFALNSFRSQVRELTGTQFERRELLYSQQQNLHLIAVSVRHLALLTDADVLLAEKNKLRHLQIKEQTDLQHILQNLSATDRGTGQNDLVQPTISGMRAQSEAYAAAVGKALQFAESGGIMEAANFVTQHLEPVQNRYFASLSAMITAQDHALDQSIAGLEQQGRRVISGMMLIAFILVCAGYVIARRLAASIVIPLQSCMRIADAISHGQLAQQEVAKGKGELGELLQSIQRMRTVLIQMVELMHDQAGELQTTGAELQISSTGSRQAAEHQINVLRNVLNANQRMEHTVTQNQAYAISADERAGQAAVSAAACEEAIRQLVSTMQSIQSSSEEIGKLTGEADSIAMQTNMVAINATIEAAHAGEAGKGFVVVASEVRALAQRSARAAAMIRKLVESSQSSISGGDHLVKDIHERIAGIVSGTGEVSCDMAGIRERCEQQRSQIEETSTLLQALQDQSSHSIDQLTRQQSSAITLADQSQRLQQVIQFFEQPEKLTIPLLVE